MRRILQALLALSLALTSAACARNVQDEDLADPAVKAHIESQLRGLADLDLRYVSIDVNSGVATVSGLVSTREQQRTIDRIVRRTRGVEQLLNNLVIQE
ncbi:MAG: BON domain-containing protein [Elusimicrobiota bacterium]